MLPPLLLNLVLGLTPFATSAVLSRTPDSPELRGVHPAKASLYQPLANGNWKCLDGSKEIPWNRVNDDYCDCEDGSDEPGTSACINGTFHCVNQGHIGGDISSSRVGDGLCEPECCDGSDEPEGVCPNMCEKIGNEYREKVAAENRVRKTGSKIRSSYITFAQKEKKRLEASITSLRADIETKRREEINAKNVLDHAESISQAALEHKKSSPLYAQLVSFSKALQYVMDQHETLKRREETLADILRNLKQNFNPNYQDMAVLEAVRGWEALSGETTPEGSESTSDDTTAVDPVEEEPQVTEPETVWDERALKTLLGKDLVSLLLQHEAHVSDGEGPSEVFDLESYIPDSLYPSYDTARSSIVNWLTTFGVIRGTSAPAEEVTKARDAHSKAVNALSQAERKLEQEENAMRNLFNPEFFGSEGEWKKLENTCLSKDTGEYTYEVCLFGGAMQKANRGGGNHSLGRFSSWNKDATPGTPDYYSKQHYTNGAKCWNGPHRSITVDFVCGIDNALLSITEPEKCEYRVTATSPAMCRPLQENGEVVPPASAAEIHKAKEEL